MEYWGRRLGFKASPNWQCGYHSLSPVVLLRLDSIAAPDPEVHSGCREQVLQEDPSSLWSERETLRVREWVKYRAVTPRSFCSIISPLSPQEILSVAGQSDFGGQVDT